MKKHTFLCFKCEDCLFYNTNNAFIQNCSNQSSLTKDLFGEAFSTNFNFLREKNRQIALVWLQSHKICNNSISRCKNYFLVFVIFCFSNPTMKYFLRFSAGRFILLEDLFFSSHSHILCLLFVFCSFAIFNSYSIYPLIFVCYNEFYFLSLMCFLLFLKTFFSLFCKVSFSLEMMAIKA